MKKINKLLDEEYNYIELDNGLKVIIYQNDKIVESYAKFTVLYGSNDFANNPKGIAHFLEHVKFAKPDGDYFDVFTKNNASSNAYTNYNETAYYFTSSSNFYENLLNLIEMMQNSHFTSEVIEKEMSIIEQEITMYDQMPEWVIRNHVFTNLCTKTNYGTDIAGKITDINTIQKEQLDEIFQKEYNASNMILTIVTNEELDDVVSFLNDNITLVSKENIQKYHLESNGIKTRYEEIIFEDINNPIISYSYKFNCESNKINLIDYFTLKLIDLMLFNERNPKYNELIEEGILNETLETGSIYNQDLKMFNFEMQDVKVKSFENAIDSLFSLTKKEIKLGLRIIMAREIKLANDKKNFVNKIESILLMNNSVEDYYQTLNDLNDEQIISSFNKLKEEIEKSTILMKSGKI